MGADDVAVVSRMLEAFNDADVEAIQDLIGEDAELYPLRAQLEGTAYVGRDGVVRAVADLEADWDGLRLEPDRIAAGADGIAVLARLHAQGRASGVDLDVPIGFHFRLRGGEIVYLRSHSEPSEALRAAQAPG